MEGLLWAEEMIQRHGLKGFYDDIMVDNVWDYDDFDRGALDCANHYYALDFQLFNQPPEGFLGEANHGLMRLLP